MVWEFQKRPRPARANMNTGDPRAARQHEHRPRAARQLLTPAIRAYNLVVRLTHHTARIFSEDASVRRSVILVDKIVSLFRLARRD